MFFIVIFLLVIPFHTGFQFRSIVVRGKTILYQLSADVSINLNEKSDLTPLTKVNISTPPRVYIPKNQPSNAKANLKTFNYTPLSKDVGKVYNIRNKNAIVEPKPDSKLENRNNDNFISLSNPQLLIRFKFPKEITDFKLRLVEMQSIFKEQTEVMRIKETTANNNWNGGGGGGGGGTPTYSKDPFLESFSSSTSSDKKGNARSKSGKEGDRKGTGEDFSKTKTSRRTSQDSFDDDLDNNDESYSADSESAAMDDEDYYGDDSNIGLSSISAVILQNMELEGMSLEDMQMLLYGEYGLKVNIHALRKRLQDDKSEKKGKKRTGKTRRDKVKLKNAKWLSDKGIDNGIDLPQTDTIQIRDLAVLTDIGVGEIIKHLMMNMGLMVSVTQSIDRATAVNIINSFGLEVLEKKVTNKKDSKAESEATNHQAVVDSINTLNTIERSPIVTIMGHVDHGKTTLLDSIRLTQVAKGEAGGITQAISAFNVNTNRGRNITFIDTPGHSAFSEMRKRGANVTDIVVLVVAADDGIMDQTKECIAAAKAAGCPIIVAINKIDKEGADISNLKQSLMSYGILIEEFGGETQCVELSAKKKIGIDDLLEKILLQADIMNLRTLINADAQGIVIEARVDKRLGVVVTALVHKGELKIGDCVLLGSSWGRVRRLLTDQNVEVREAGPSVPIQIIGVSSVPNAGDTFVVTASEADAREVAEARQRLSKQALGSASSAAIISQAAVLADGNVDNREIIKVPIVIKADVTGSVEAIRQALEAIEISDDFAICKVDVVIAGVGDVTSSDIAIAAVSKAKVIAFGVTAGFNSIEEARSLNVDIGYYNVVYELLDELENKLKVTLAPPPPGKLVGRGEIKKIFKLGKAGKIAGCLVLEGVIKTESKVRIMRGKRNPVYTGSLSTLKVVKDDVKEVPVGSDCGMSFRDFSDFEEGDIIECFITGNDVI